MRRRAPRTRRGPAHPPRARAQPPPAAVTSRARTGGPRHSGGRREWSSARGLLLGRVGRRRRPALELDAVGAPGHQHALDPVAREEDVDHVTARIVERWSSGGVALVEQVSERPCRAACHDLAQAAARLPGRVWRLLPARRERVTGDPVWVPCPAHTTRCGRVRLGGRAAVPGGVPLRRRTRVPECPDFAQHLIGGVEGERVGANRRAGGDGTGMDRVLRAPRKRLLHLLAIDVQVNRVGREAPVGPGGYALAERLDELDLTPLEAELDAAPRQGVRLSALALDAGVPEKEAKPGGLVELHRVAARREVAPVDGHGSPAPHAIVPFEAYRSATMT